jgi:hypothetical protein
MSGHHTVAASKREECLGSDRSSTVSQSDSLFGKSLALIMPSLRAITVSQVDAPQ